MREGDVTITRVTWLPSVQQAEGCDIARLALDFTLQNKEIPTTLVSTARYKTVERTTLFCDCQLVMTCRSPWVKHTHSNSKSPYFLIFREDGVVVYSLVKNFCLRPSRSVQKHVNATSCAYRTHLRAYSLLSVWRTWKQTSISQRMDCRQKKWRCKNNAWRSTCDAKTSQSSYKYVILNDT